MRLLAIILIFSLVACGRGQRESNLASENNPLCAVLPGKRQIIGPSKSGVQYFPPSFGKPSHVCNFKGYPECFPKVGTFESEWYAGHWEAAHEPSLYMMPDGKPSAGHIIVRFTWLPTFHHPVIIRFDISPNGTDLIAKELSGAGGYEPGTIKRTLTRKLEASEARRLAETLKNAPFGEPSADCSLGLDGSQWTLERANGSSYEYVTRWSPKHGPVRDFGMVALKMTGWKFEEIY
jgi:hypothetical protein